MNKEKREFLKELIGSIMALLLLFMQLPATKNNTNKIEKGDIVLEIKDEGLVVRRRS